MSQQDMRRCVLQVVLYVSAAELMAMKQLIKKKSIYCFLIIYFLIFQGLFDHFYVTRLKKRQSLAAFMVQVFPEMALAMWICALSPLVTAT